MSQSQPLSKAEMEALWAAVFGGPPPIDASPEMLIDVLVRCLPQPEPYGYEAPEPPKKPVRTSGAGGR